MAGRLGLTLRLYRALEVGELNITSDLYERIVGRLEPRGAIGPGPPSDLVLRTEMMGPASTETGPIFWS